jgi:hypothetical protein
MLDQLDSLAGNCGLSLPTLFERTGSMAAHGQHRPRDFTPRAYGACSDPSLPGTPATRNAGPEVLARPPVKTTATSIASRTGRAARQPGYGWRAKGIRGNHRTSTRCEPARPARTACEDDTDLPCVRTCPGTFTSARVRQLETEGDRQAVPRADR